MEADRQLTDYIRAKALAEGAILTGFTRIRKVEPVIVFAYPFSDRWFLKQIVRTAKDLGRDSLLSKHVHDTVTEILNKEGYEGRRKSVLSVYGDFRPLAVAAGLGEWGRNGLIVNKDYGSAMLFSAIFTDAPLLVEEKKVDQDADGHCRDCGECIEACPQKAFRNGGIDFERCFVKSVKGCAECLKACKRN